MTPNVLSSVNLEMRLHDNQSRLRATSAKSVVLNGTQIKKPDLISTPTIKSRLVSTPDKLTNMV